MEVTIGIGLRRCWRIALLAMVLIAGILATSREDGSTHAQLRSPSAAEAPEMFSNGNFVNDLAYDSRRNVVWAATSGGVVQWELDGHTYHKFTTLDGLPSNIVMSVAVNERSGDVWFGTYSGLVQLTRGGSWWCTPTDFPTFPSRTS